MSERVDNKVKLQKMSKYHVASTCQISQTIIVLSVHVTRNLKYIQADKC